MEKTNQADQEVQLAEVVSRPVYTGEHFIEKLEYPESNRTGKEEQGFKFRLLISWRRQIAYSIASALAVLMHHLISESLAMEARHKLMVLPLLVLLDLSLIFMIYRPSSVYQNYGNDLQTYYYYAGIGLNLILVGQIAQPFLHHFSLTPSTHRYTLVVHFCLAYCILAEVGWKHHLHRGILSYSQAPEWEQLTWSFVVSQYIIGPVVSGFLHKGVIYMLGTFSQECADCWEPKALFPAGVGGYMVQKWVLMRPLNALNASLCVGVQALLDQCRRLWREEEF